MGAAVAGGRIPFPGSKLGGGSGGASANEKIEQVGITIDGGGEVITTGIKGYIQIPFAATIVGWTLLSTDDPVVTGSIVVDVWKDTYANYPPTVADTITAAAKPTLSSVNKNTDSTLTGWNTAVAAGDVLGFKVDSVTTLKKVTLLLKLSKAA
jgi:hypothetical protein